MLIALILFVCKQTGWVSLFVVMVTDCVVCLLLFAVGIRLLLARTTSGLLTSLMTQPRRTREKPPHSSNMLPWRQHSITMRRDDLITLTRMVTLQDDSYCETGRYKCLCYITATRDRRP